MIAFIQQEAAEKVEEIEAKAEEEFNIEKSRLVSQQRVKIIEYYDKKEKQIELQRKIQHSNLANASRLSILKARDDYVQSLKEEARKQLAILTQDRTKYTTILANLIAQGLFLLMEKEITLRCRRNDYDLVQQLIPEAVNRYKQELKQKDLKISVDDKNFLPDESLVFNIIFFKINFLLVLELVVLNFMQWVEKLKYPIQLKLDFQ
jgi:V-type H+-transporting ATPase subunit E